MVRIKGDFIVVMTMVMLLFLLILYLLASKDNYFVKVIVLIGLFLILIILISDSRNSEILEIQKLYYTQKLIIENDEKVVLRKTENNTDYYRVNLDNFFIDFNIYENSDKGKMDWSLSTDKEDVLKYFNIEEKEISIKDNETEDNNYKAFKEKYLLLEKTIQK